MSLYKGLSPSSDDLRPLLEVARQRFDKLGWKHVVCLCEDAATFEMPASPSGTRSKADLITMVRVDLV